MLRASPRRLPTLIGRNHTQSRRLLSAGVGASPELGAQSGPKKKAAGAAFLSLWMVLTRSTPKGEV